MIEHGRTCGFGESMQCESCGTEIDEDDVVVCPGCGVILCPGCDVGGFCTNCAGGNLD